MGYRHKEVLKGLAAGALGGLIASWTMNKFQEAWTGAGEALKNDRSRRREPNGHGEEATMKTAGIVCKVVLRRELSRDQWAAVRDCVVHWCGWVALPALKLTETPNKFPVPTHLYGLSSHWAYALTTELVRRVVRKVR
jgi:hypothetical protein